MPFRRAKSKRRRVRRRRRRRCCCCCHFTPRVYKTLRAFPPLPYLPPLLLPLPRRPHPLLLIFSTPILARSSAYTILILIFTILFAFISIPIFTLLFLSLFFAFLILVILVILVNALQVLVITRLPQNLAFQLLLGIQIRIHVLSLLGQLPATIQILLQQRRAIHAIGHTLKSIGLRFGIQIRAFATVLLAEHLRIEFSERRD
mmetsp:Transcript_4468/g.7996  ORF Transcript_4468/g.7996 Transcript_4468/m.7996 type:complete len:203 (-) Transcript_4468:952-1560(-)